LPGDVVRIGVDASCWANGRGYGRFTRELLRTMVAQAPADEWVCFADARAAASFDIEAANVRLVRVAQNESPTEAAAADGHRSAADMLRFTRAVWKERLDVFFSPSVYTYFPLPPGVPAVVAIHDTIPERFPELTLPSKRARLFWRGKVRLALAQAKLVLTVSEYSARELGTVLRVPRGRIRVVQPAPSQAYRPEPADAAMDAAARYGVPSGSPWFTYVGGFNPHKRVESVVRAHAEVVRSGRHRPHLLLVGSLTDDVFHANVQEIRDAVAAGCASDLVHWTGFVADDELRRLHSGATALILASAAEGFGLPAVEAAACGAAVIATTASPLPEVLAGGGIFVEPGDVGAIAAAMHRLLDDSPERVRMGERGRQCAARLRWDNGARVALDALHEAAPRALAAAT
jgi:glycosyltransferase involved in cell wall biosynthesis